MFKNVLSQYYMCIICQGYRENTKNDKLYILRDKQVKEKCDNKYVKDKNKIA